LGEWYFFPPLYAGLHCICTNFWDHNSHLINVSLNQPSWMDWLFWG
jgi:hypothetical protein